MALYLVDGHALAFRSYYAFVRQPLVNSRGEETSAVFGFLNTMLGLISSCRPDYLAVIFDTPAKTFRHEKFSEYKANREEPPESLIEQLKVIYTALETMKIPQFSLERFEADDLIATISRKLENDVPVRIISGDKDLLQLVTDRIHVIRPGRTNVLEKEVDPDGMVESMGLRADQIVDYLALMGDTSDNVPGVRGIGQKTALKLMQEHESLDALYDNLEAVLSQSVRKKLEEGRASAFLSRELITLDDDVPVTFTLEDMVMSEFRTPAFRSMLEDLDFRRLSQKLFSEVDTKPVAELADESAASNDSPVEGHRYELVDSPDRLAQLAKELESAPTFAVDVETSSLARPSPVSPSRRNPGSHITYL
jgi:DNA polymerase-1